MIARFFLENRSHSCLGNYLEIVAVNCVLEFPTSPQANALLFVLPLDK